MTQKKQASAGFLERNRPGSDRSFFHALQSHLKNKLDGRYMGMILEELGNREPDTMVDILRSARPGPNLREIEKALNAKTLRFQREYRLPNGKQPDLVVLRKDTPLALLEIKVNDRNTPLSGEQLVNYEEYLRQNPQTSFFHLSWHRPTKFLAKVAGQEVKNRWHDLRYSDVLDSLRGAGVEARYGTLSVMLRDFLEDLGVDVYRPIDFEAERDALTYLVLQMCGFSHRATGLGKLHSKSTSEAGPELLRLLMGNLSATVEWIREANREVAKRPAVTRFGTKRWYNKAKVAKEAAEADDDEPFELNARLVKQGALWLESYLSVRSQTPRWAYVGAGIYLEVDLSHPEEKKVRLSYYGYITAQGQDVCEVDSGWLQEFPDEMAARRLFGNLIRKSIKKSKTAGSCPSVMSELVLPLMK